MCKKTYSTNHDSNDTTLELEPVANVSDCTHLNENCSNPPLRRRSRLAKLKENVE